MGAANKTQIIVYIEIILFVLAALSTLICISLPTVLIDWMLEDEMNPMRKEEMKAEVGKLTLIVAGAAVTTLLMWLIILIALYRGSRDRSVGQLMSWIIFNCIVCALLIFALLSFLIKSPATAAVLIPILVFIFYRVWSLHVVHTLLNEIRFLPQQAQLQAQSLYAVQFGQPSQPIY